MNQKLLQSESMKFEYISVALMNGETMTFKNPKITIGNCDGLSIKDQHDTWFYFPIVNINYYSAKLKEEKDERTCNQ